MNTALALTFAALSVTPERPDSTAAADDTKEMISKGLDWLAKQQAADGSWSGNNGIFPAAITALAGTALLMEGSTLGEGKYAGHIRKAVGWFIKNARPSGLLVPAGNSVENGRYMVSHGYALIFLGCAYGEEDDGPCREELGKVLQKAIAFTADAQTERGGWGFLMAAEGSGIDETHATAVVLQGLLAARASGLPVSKTILDKAQQYFDTATRPDGGVVPTLASGPEGSSEAMITAEAAVCALRSRPSSARLVRWVVFAARSRDPDLKRNQGTNVILQHFNFARVAYALGNEGHRLLDPEVKESDLVMWDVYRKALYRNLKNAQRPDGSWPDPVIGPTYFASLGLIILQLDKGYLPFFSR
ncbi:MAG: hypothetical protein JWO38_3737 [Gemmataceae bacterium]|nr:hypothetical protein [Gemmataceae bacterium]